VRVFDVVDVIDVIVSVVNPVNPVKTPRTSGICGGFAVEFRGSAGRAKPADIQGIARFFA
jgi:hypothetical protein